MTTTVRAFGMTESAYEAERAAIRTRFGGDTPGERTAAFDQALASLFHRSGWTLERLAKVETKSIAWVERRTRFGRFLHFSEFSPTGEKPRNLTEGRFRGYWEQTDPNEKNERIRFREVLRILTEEITLSRPHHHKPRIAEAIKAACAGDWHRLSTIITKVQTVVAEATEADVKGVLNGMVFKGTYDVFAEQKGGTYRIVVGGKRKVDLVVLKTEMDPILEGLRAEGQKNMATMSPGTVAHLTHKLEKLLEKLAQISKNTEED